MDRPITLPPEYNLERARQEHAKAALCTSPWHRDRHLELAAIFEARAANDAGTDGRIAAA